MTKQGMREIRDTNRPCPHCGELMIRDFILPMSAVTSYRSWQTFCPECDSGLPEDPNPEHCEDCS